MGFFGPALPRCILVPYMNERNSWYSFGFAILFPSQSESKVSRRFDKIPTANPTLGRVADALRRQTSRVKARERKDLAK